MYNKDIIIIQLHGDTFICMTFLFAPDQKQLTVVFILILSAFIQAPRIDFIIRKDTTVIEFILLKIIY